MVGNAADGPPPTVKNTKTATNDLDGRKNGSVKMVRSMSLAEFPSNLVTHFNIAYERNEVIWPRRFGNNVPPPPTIL